MKIYYDTPQSRKLIEINREYVNFRKNPRMINPKNLLERLWKYSFILVRFVHRYILERNIYDYKKELKEREYEVVSKPIEYEELPRVAVYTCITGGYDSLEEPAYVNDSISYYAFTDFEIPNDSIWKRIDLAEIKQIQEYDNIQKARYVKTHPHEFLCDYDYSVWVDGNIIIMADVMPLVLDMMKHETVFGCHMHPHRKKISTEAKAIIAMKRTVVNDKLENQVKEYYSHGYKDQFSLFETSILVRKHNDENCRKLMDEWWEQIAKFTTRDQISLPYSLWKVCFNRGEIANLGYNYKLNPRFRYRGHK